MVYFPLPSFSLLIKTLNNNQKNPFKIASFKNALKFHY